MRREDRFPGSDLLVSQHFLRAELNGKPMSIQRFLLLARNITAVLKDYHHVSGVHTSINPEHIIINELSDQALLSSPHLLPDINITKYQPLAYVSPEQTGRLNQVLDYRSDLYSLGITFYEMMTGKLPFDAQEPLEWIHCHIARNPLPPAEANPTIPLLLSSIVMKLISKSPQERYQTSQGLLHDLELCLEQWNVNGEFADIVIARQDVSDTLLIPQRLYGREAAFEKLLAAFDVVTAKHTPQVVMISGYSGIGKTALVRELYTAVAGRYAYFISGKFEQYITETPYSSITESFSELVQQLLGESDEILDEWRDKICNALGANIQLIIDLIPQLEIITGRQKPVMQMPPAQAQNRFHMAFGQFMSVFGSSDRPLVWFLDDMQWIDPASLKLLMYLTGKPEVPPFLFIGSYRDNEMTPDHPLWTAINSLQDISNRLLHFIELRSLSITDITSFLIDALPYAVGNVGELGEIFFDKTAGNPFFMIQLLKSLHAENLIFFDKVAGGWNWDISGIKKIGYTDNVVDFMLVRLRTLDNDTQQILQIGACIGSIFDLRTLTLSSGAGYEQVQESLQKAIREALVLQYGDNVYRFQHDRIQQAAYNLIPEELRERIHLQIGKMLASNTSPKNLESDIFAIVNQLNIAINLINEQEDKSRLAHFNLLAGQKAKAATAYGPAFKYLQTAIALLDQDSWNTQYELTLRLYEEAAETAYLLGSYVETNSLVDSVLKNAHTVLDKTMAYMVKIDFYIAQSRINKAVETGLEILGLLGLTIPKKPRSLNIDIHVLRTKWIFAGHWRGKPVEDLLELPEMTDPVSIAQIEIMNTIFSALYIMNDPLMPLDASFMAELSIRYGNHSVSPYGYATYGFILCARYGDIETGYLFGQLALRLLEEKLTNSKAAAKTIYAVHGFSTHSKQHLRDCLPGLLEVSRIGMETGDFEYAARALTLHPRYMFLLGEPLLQVNKILDHNTQTIQQLKQQGSHIYVSITQQAVTNLLKETPDPVSLNGPYYEEETMLPVQAANNDTYGIFQVYFHKLLLAYIFNDYARAAEYAEQVRERVFSATAQYFYYYSFAYDSLAQLASFDNANPVAQKNIIKRVSSNQSKLKKWAHHAPMNHQHRWHMVEGELARIKSQYLLAHQHFLQAIELANQNGYVYEEALTLELLGRLHYKTGNLVLSSTFLKEARACYARWGADAKVKDMDKYNQVPATITNYSIEGLDLPRAMHPVSLSPLDLATVLKASHAISEEMMLQPLLDKLMYIVIEHAGAQRGILLTNQDNRLRPAAQATVLEGRIELMEKQEDLTDELPWSIINYVKNTRESVIINGPQDKSLYASDPYIKRNQPHSMLSLPVVKQNRLIAILYLENNLLAGTFTPEKLSILELMASQIAISIENASLYSSLSSSEERYRTIFQNTGTAMMFVEEDMTISISNKEFSKLTGYSSEEIDGKMTWMDFIYDDTELQRMQEYHRLRRVNPGAVPSSYEFKLKDRNGGNRDIVISVVQMPGAKQSLAALLDITKRKKAEEALRQSEVKYRTIFENTGTGMIFVEEDMTISLSNKELAKLTGYSNEEIDGKMKWTDFIYDEEDLQRMKEYHFLRRTGPAAAPTTYEFKLRNRNGDLLYAVVSVVTMPGTTQSLAALVDITKRKQAEEALRLSEITYRAIFENTGTATIIVEANTTITLANSEFCRWSGYSKEEVEGKLSWLHFVRGEHGQMALRHHQDRRLAMELVPDKYDLTVYDREDNPKNILLTVAMINDNQSVIGMVDITERLEAEEEVRRLNADLEMKVDLRTQDLTAANQELISMNQELHELNNEFEAANDALFREIAERKKIEEELAAANRELSNIIEQLKATQMSLVWSEKMASLGRLVAGVAHEINTPVGVGVTAATNLEQITREFTRLINDDKLTRQGLHEYLDDCQTAVSIITSNLNRASQLIRSFKEVSVDQTSETRRIFRMKGYLDEILLSLHPKLKKTSHVIAVDCDEALEIDSYPGAFAQILTNLVMNSLIHAYNPDEKGQFTIKVRKLEDSLQLEYSDDGKGIEPENLAKIFDPFFTTNREHGGTGLGLSIVYNIVTIQLEGSIECSSQPGQGTHFRIRVPLTNQGYSS